MWPIILSDRLRVVGLVSRYLTNYLIRREPLSWHRLAAAFLPQTHIQEISCGISPGFPGLSPTTRQVAHVLRTRSPLSPGPKPEFTLDLHVLGAPPAFVLSQDQTLHRDPCGYPGRWAGTAVIGESPARATPARVGNFVN